VQLIFALANDSDAAVKTAISFAPAAIAASKPLRLGVKTGNWVLPKFPIAANTSCASASYHGATLSVFRLLYKAQSSERSNCIESPL
jgi:hypothetical protein